MARKERNIYKRKDGRYEARYIKGRDEQGKAVYGAVYARSYSGVKDKLERVKQSIKQSALPNTLRTVSAELENYLVSLKPQIKQSTYGVYLRYLENYITPYFKDIRCSQLTQEIIQGFVNRQLENGLSAVTVRSVFCFLRNGLGNAISKDISRIKLPKYIPNKVSALTVEEQKRLESVAKASDHIDHISIIICLYTGIRIGELCGLLWSDIDFERNLLHIRRTLQRIKNIEGATKTVIVSTPPKSAASKRSIPLPGFLVSLLKEQRIHSVGNYIINHDGKAVEPRNIQYRFKNLLEAANIRSENFHILRHTFSTRALENGFDVKTLSEILGHSSAAVTLKKYAHTLDEHKRKSMESLSAVYH